MTSTSMIGSGRLLRSMVRYGYFPLMFAGLNGTAVTIVAVGASASVVATTIVGLVAVALALSFAAERVLPYEPEWNTSRGDLGRDVVHFVVNESMSLGPLLLVPVLAAAAPQPSSTPWPTSWPLLAQAFFALAVFDLGQNLFHRASHVWPPLWRLHAVHHCVERMYGLNGILKHPIYQVVSSAVSIAPLMLLGMPRELTVVVAFCSSVQLLLQHSNADYRTGPVRHLCSTAEVHRFHHLRGEAGDVNFALFFAFWDHLLGNAYHDERRLGTRDIGLDYEAYPVDYVGQLMAPFRHFERRPVSAGARGEQPARD